MWIKTRTFTEGDETLIQPHSDLINYLATACTDRWGDRQDDPPLHPLSPKSTLVTLGVMKQLLWTEQLYITELTFITCTLNQKRLHG